MTTISLKDGVLAADSRASQSGLLKSDNFPKIFDVSDKQYTLCGNRVLVYAMAGFVYSRLVLDMALKEGIDVGSGIESDDDFSAIIVTEGPSYHIDKQEDNPLLRIIEIPDGVHWAIGSGSMVANYIMLRGGDAVSAVVEAIRVDSGSGGDVIVWDGPEWEIEAC